MFQYIYNDYFFSIISLYDIALTINVIKLWNRQSRHIHVDATLTKKFNATTRKVTIAEHIQDKLNIEAMYCGISFSWSIKAFRIVYSDESPIKYCNIATYDVYVLTIPYSPVVSIRVNIGTVIRDIPFCKILQMFFPHYTTAIDTFSSIS